MDQRFLEFFEDLPVHASIPIKTCGAKYEKLDTYTLACILFNQSVLRKVVCDQMKEATSRVVNQTIKCPTSEFREYIDIQLTPECELFVDNYLYFKHRYNGGSDVMTTFMTFDLCTNKYLKSYKFFEDFLYLASKDEVREQLQEELLAHLQISRSDSLPQYGKYLTNPFYKLPYTCSGREDEIQRCINILSRYNKSNVLLVGKSGVGKTSIVYGICNYLQSEKCPECLKGCDVFSLSITKLVSGTTYRGDLEKRLSDLVDEIGKFDRTIVFIDELQTIFNTSSSESDSSTIPNALKPFLTGDSKFIGCTTESGYKALENDAAFERRFCVVNVSEPSETQTVDYLKNSKSVYEDYHNVHITDENIEDIVHKCGQYIKNRNFPDKAFDCLDIVCTNCKLNHSIIITKKDIEQTVYTMVNVNTKNFDISRVDTVKEELKSTIFGQDDAIEGVCANIKRYFLGVANKEKPIGTFLFVGPTGTGKTELAKQLAKKFFSDGSFIRFDMSEFMEPHSVSKLIGSPPGYVGYANKGELTERVKHNPFSILLFDEIEKAHKDVVNVLLQIMDDGRLTDSFGTSVNFCNCLIIMTSNLGCKEYLDNNKIGFGSSRDQGVIKKSVDNHFSPEFRNRIDSIVYFNPISEEMFEKIFQKELTSFLASYKECGYNVTISDNVIKDLKSNCYDEKNGVRFVQRKIATTLEQRIIGKITNGETDIFIE